MQPLRILLVDDHEVIRRGLRSLLSSRPEWHVCGEAVNGAEGVKRAKELNPDVVLMDVSMPELGGAEATRQIRQFLPDTHVIIVSQNEPAITRRQMRDAGAAGYVAKAHLSRDLLTLIDKIIEKQILQDQLSNPPERKSVKEELSGPKWLMSGGEMGSRIRAKDWARTPLGPPERWPQSLKTCAGICVSSRFDLIVWWGSELIMLYNDSYCRTLGAKHPQALGTPGRQVYPEIWDVVGPMLDQVLATGEATWSEDLLLLLERNGYQEETYHTFSYTPVRDEYGKVVGIITPVAETTQKVIRERRLLTLRDLGAKSVDAKNESEAWEFSAHAIGGNPYDIPFAVLYKLNDETTEATVVASAGIAIDHPFFLEHFQLSEGQGLASQIGEVVRLGRAVEYDQLDKLDFSLPGGFWGVSPTKLILLPIAQTGQETAIGVLVVGVNRHKRLDEDYRGFLNQVAGQIAKCVADLRILDQERKRAEEAARRLSAQILRAQDRERRKLARTMHDSLGQYLAVLKLNLDACLKTVESPNPRRLIAESCEIIQQCLSESRTISYLLYPPLLDESGLNSVLPWYVEDFAQRSGIQVSLDAPSEIPRFSQEVEIALFRILQESLTNVRRHAKSGRADIAIQLGSDTVSLTVRDYGCGIAPDRLKLFYERGAGIGIGLASMRERAWQLGGTLWVRSAAGEGTIISAEIPAGVTNIRTSGSEVE